MNIFSMDFQAYAQAGVPNLNIEILFPSNTTIEIERKLKLYQDVEVREYWIVTLENNGVIV
jgi:Uma2 family endonuclease